MYGIQERYSAYKRGFYYFVIYSAILFVVTDATFWHIKTLFYFPIGFTLGGDVAALLMSIQYKIEKQLQPNFWILNIFIDIVGWYIFAYALFYLFFEII